MILKSGVIKEKGKVGAFLTLRLSKDFNKISHFQFKSRLKEKYRSIIRKQTKNALFRRWKKLITNSIDDYAPLLPLGFGFDKSISLA